jgi:hypothetical protein
MVEASKSAGRVRRSNVNDAYWVERFMSARRIMPDTASRDRRPAEQDERAGGPSRKRPGRNAAIRALEELAGALIRRRRR